MTNQERQNTFKFLELLYKLPVEKQKEVYYITQGARFVAGC